MAEHVKPKRSIGAVTTATATGGSLGAAIAQLLVHVFPYLEGTESALTIILTALLALAGGYLVPPREDRTEHEVIEIEKPGEELIEEEVTGPTGVAQSYDFR